MNDLYNNWEQYKRKVVPRDAPFGQHQEVRRAWYHGANTVLYLLSQLDNHRATEAEKILFIEALQKEVKDFRLQVQADLA